MKKNKLVYAALAISVFVIENSCSKSGSSTPNTAAYFPKVKSIIASNCLSCHSSTGSWSGRPTAFDSDSAIASSATIIKTSVAGPWSFMLKQMPSGSSLSATDIATIDAWVSKGGKTTD